MAGSDEEKGTSAKPSEQRGGTTPDEKEARAKGEWGGKAGEGIVPAELGGSDAPREMLAEDPELDSAVLGRTTGSDEPATEEGVDLSAGDDADATADGGAEGVDLSAGDDADATADGGADLPEDAEPDLKDIGAASRRDEGRPAG